MNALHALFDPSSLPFWLIVAGVITIVLTWMLKGSPPEASGELPLEEVRYGSLLADAGVTRHKDLRELGAITDVDGIGTHRASVVIDDLMGAGLSPEHLPPMTSEPAEETLG